MAYFASQGRFSSISAMRGSETPRSEQPNYVSPTFKSSVFSHLDTTYNATTPAQESYSELRMAAKKRVNRVERYSHILPTCNEWNPKGTDINNPDAYNQAELDAVKIANRKNELEYTKLKEHKEKLNAEVREQLQEVEKKFQSRLDHKKPAPEVRQEHKEAEAQYWSETADQLDRMKETKNGYARDLQVQMHKKSLKKQFETENEKKDVRTGFDMKPRKEYDMQEYKNVLKKQVTEKTIKKAQEKSAKDEEKQERLNELRNQERMIEHFRDQISHKRSQTAYTESDAYTPERFKTQSKNQTAQTGVETNNIRSSKIRLETANDKKSDWETASLIMIKKKEEQDEHLRGLKEQMVVKNMKKDVESSKKLEEERAITGFDLGHHKPKISLKQVTEVLKHQMKEKEAVKNNEVQVKKAETAAKKQEYKAEERVAWQQYEEYCQKKMEMFDRYKKDYSTYAPIKKNKGLMTVKI